MELRHGLAIFGLLLLSACGGTASGPVSDPSEQTETPKTSSEGAEEPALTVKDLAYATLSDSQKLDLYLPVGPTPTPVVVYVHGGGFRQGDKDSTMFQTIATALMAKGFAVASLNYRLSGEAPFPAAIRDVKTAVRWLRAHAEEYGLDPNKIGAWGDSAGANIASLLGTSCGDGFLEGLSLGNGDQSSCVQAIVDWYGNTDFLQMDAQAETDCSSFSHDAATSPESVYMGFSIQDNPDQVQKANPITYISSEDPAFFIQHGTEDCTVPPLQSQIFYDALMPVVGTEKVTLMYLEGAGHGGPEFLLSSNLELVLDFLDERLKQN